ncbi:MAG: cell wall-binding repeat-containing protein, partial [Erysipelotrichaceae bacterium]|nr:cell wall-binding repeat-containing protein [Erysipelotrichaceae bacterium]
TAYLDSRDWRHFSSALGNKGSGCNVQYASDPYWSLKIAAYAYDLDKYANNGNGKLTDYGVYSLAMVKHTGTAVKAAPDDNAATLYTVHAGKSSTYLSDYTVIVLERGAAYTKIQTTNAIVNGSIVSNYDNTYPQLIPYDFNTSVGYIRNSELTFLHDGPGDFLGSLDSLSLDETSMSLKGTAYREGYVSDRDHVSVSLSIGNNTYPLSFNVNEDVVSFTGTIDLTNLPHGDHPLSVKTSYSENKDANGKFALTTGILPSSRHIAGKRVYLSSESDGLHLHVTAIPAGAEVIDRIYGKNRYDTSLKCADALKEVWNVSRFHAVVLVTGSGYADALSGAYFAYSIQAPVLLIDQKNAAKIVSYINGNTTGNAPVYVLGGEIAVSSSWLTGLGGHEVIRLSGSSRYETNLAILKRLSVPGDVLLIASGSNYPDALSASAVDAPVLLVGKNLTAAQRNYLKASSYKKIYLLGGTGAVSEDIENALSAYAPVTRLSGRTRYETSRFIAETFYPMPEGAVLVYGQNFPDGLSAGVLARAKGYPILLASNKSPDDARIYAVFRKIRKGTVIGGTSLISDP